MTLTPAQAAAQFREQQQAERFAQAAQRADAVAKEGDAGFFGNAGRIIEDRLRGVGASFGDMALVARKLTPAAVATDAVRYALDLPSINDTIRTQIDTLRAGTSATQKLSRQAIDDADGFWGTAEALVRDPASVAGYAIDGIPYMLPGLYGAAAGASAKGLGLINAGLNAALTHEQTYQGALKAGASEFDAQRAAATAVPFSAATGYLGGRITAPLDKYLVGQGKKISAIPAMFLEGGEEVVEGVGNNFGENLGYRTTVAPGQALNAGMAKSAAMDFVVGGATGGSMSGGRAFYDRATGRVVNAAPQPAPLFTPTDQRAPTAVDLNQFLVGPRRGEGDISFKPGVPAQYNIDGTVETPVMFTQPTQENLGGVVNFENPNQPDMFGAPSAVEQRGWNPVPPWEGESQFAAQPAQQTNAPQEPAHLVALREAADEVGARAFNRDGKPVGGRGRGSLYKMTTAEDVPAAIRANYNSTAANAPLLDTWHMKLTGMSVEDAQLRETQGAQQDIFGGVAINEYKPEAPDAEQRTPVPKEQQRLFTKEGQPKYYARGDRKPKGGTTAEPAADVAAQVRATLDQTNPKQATFVSDATLEQPEVQKIVQNAQAVGATVVRVGDGQESGVLVAETPQFANAYADSVNAIGVEAANRIALYGSAVPTKAETVAAAEQGDAPVVVQAKDPQGNVVAEAVSPESQVEQVAAAVAPQGSKVEVTTPEVAQGRRSALAQAAEEVSQQIANRESRTLTARQQTTVDNWNKRREAKQLTIAANEAKAAEIEATISDLDTKGKTVSDASKVEKLETQLEGLKEKNEALRSEVLELSKNIDAMYIARSVKQDGRGKHSKAKQGDSWAAQLDVAGSELVGGTRRSALEESLGEDFDENSNAPGDRQGWPQGVNPLVDDPRPRLATILRNIAKETPESGNAIMREVVAGEPQIVSMSPEQADAIVEAMGDVHKRRRDELTKIIGPELRGGYTINTAVEAAQLAADINASVAAKVDGTWAPQGWASLAEHSGGMTRAAARSALGTLGAKLEAAGILKLVTTLDGVAGNWRGGKEIYVALDTASKEQIRAVVLHELLHMALGKAFAETTFGKQLLAQATQLANDPNAPAWVRGAVAEITARHEKAGKAVPVGDRMGHEVLAYALENYETYAARKQHLGKFGKLIADFIGHIKAVLLKHGAKLKLGDSLRKGVDPATLRAVALMAIKAETTASPAAATQFNSDSLESEPTPENFGNVNATEVEDGDMAEFMRLMQEQEAALPKNPMARARALAATLLRAAAKNPSLFQFPAVPKSVTQLNSVQVRNAAKNPQEVQEGLLRTLQANDPEVEINTNVEGAEAGYVINNAGGRPDNVTFMFTKPGRADANGNVDWVEIDVMVQVATRTRAFMGNPDIVQHMRPGDVFIDVSRGMSGAAGGAATYQSVADFAYNTHGRFVGDPSGLTSTALIRRTEHMLSSAIKHGTTDHIAPHPAQVDPKKYFYEAYGAASEATPVKWTDGDTVANIASMIHASTENHQRMHPEWKDDQYDFATGHATRGATGQTVGSVAGERSGGMDRPREGSDVQSLAGVGDTRVDARSVDGTGPGDPLSAVAVSGTRFNPSATQTRAALLKTGMQSAVDGSAGSGSAGGQDTGRSLASYEQQLGDSSLLDADPRHKPFYSLPGVSSNANIPYTPEAKAKASPKLLGAMTLHQIADVYGDIMGGLREKVDVMRRRGAAYVNHYERVQELSAKTEQLNDNARVMMESIMQSAKRAGYDPAAYDATDKKTHPRTDNHTLLLKQWQQLDPAAQALYVEHRDFYESVWTDLYAAMKRAIELGRATTESKTSQLQKLAETFEARRVPYFPSMRYGDFVVIARDADGKVVGYYQRETESERDALAKELAAKGAKVELTKREHLQDTVPLSTLLGTSEELARAMRGYAAQNGLSKQESDAASSMLHELLLDRLPETHAANSLRSYKGTAGEDGDSVRGLATYATRMGALLANTSLRPEEGAASVDLGNSVRGKPEQHVVHWLDKGQVKALAFNSASELTQWLAQNVSTLPRTSGSYPVADFGTTTVPYGMADDVTTDLAKTNPALAAAVKAAVDAVAPLEAPAQHRDALANIQNELHLRDAQMDTGELNTIVRALTGITYARFLWWSVKQVVGNFAQVASVTYTELGGKYGWNTAGKAMAGAMARFGKVWASGLNNFDGSKSFNPQKAKGLTHSERAVMQMLMDYKLLDFTMSRDVAQTAAGDNSVMQKAFSVMGYFNHQSEMLIRGSTALATYELAQKRGANQAQALAETRRVVESTLGDYSEVNKARYMRITAVRPAAQFRNYQQQMIVRNLQLGMKAFKGDSVAQQQFAGMVALTTLMSGVRGAPFMGLIAVLAMGLRDLGDDDEMFKNNNDPISYIESLLSDLFGDGAGRVLTHGMIQEMFGVSIQSSIGQADLVPGFNLREGYTTQGTKSEMANVAETILGPSGGMLKGMFSSAEFAGIALDAAQRGDSQTAWSNAAKAVESTSPAFVGHLVKAGRFAKEGSTNRQGELNADPEKIKELSTLIKTGLGTTPAWLDALRREQLSTSNFTKRLMDQQSALVSAFVTAQRNGGDTQGALENIVKWNAKVQKNVRIPTDKLLVTYKDVSGSEKRADRDATVAAQTGYLAQNSGQADIMVQSGEFDLNGGMTQRPQAPRPLRPLRPMRPGAGGRFESEPQYYYTGDE